MQRCLLHGLFGEGEIHRQPEKQGEGRHAWEHPIFLYDQGKQLRLTTVSILPTATYTELTKDNPESP